MPTACDSPDPSGPEDRVPKSEQAKVALEKLRTLAGMIHKDNIS